MKDTQLLRIAVSERAGEVAALLRRPRDARWLLVLAHGAGADMHHAFMQAMSERLAERRIASLRFQFPYMEKGRRAPDRAAVLQDTVRAAIGAAAKHAGELPLLAGGKSMGGRMTSLAAAETGLPGVRALVFFGFPLHAAGRPSAERGEHLEQVSLPMLFLQGTRDKLAELALLRPICQQLGRRATLHEVENGDHSFHVLKRSGRTDNEALDELVDSVSDWTEKLVV